MKFEDFKSLMIRRRELIEKKLSATSEYDRNEYEIQIEELDETFFGSYEYSNIKLNKIFNVGAENVKKMLIKFFQKHDDADVEFFGFVIKLAVVTDKNNYVLGTYTSNESLQCLYSKTNTDWESLLSDYPDLEEYLWNEFYEIKTGMKRKEMTLIQRKLKEKNKELDLLTNPQKLQARIEELQKEKRKYEEKISCVEHEIENIFE